VVKNLRTGSRLNQASYFDKVWSQLDAALSAIFDGKKPDISLEELYKGAENMCRQGRAPVLAKKLQNRCKEHVTGKLRENLVTRAGGGNDVDTLRAVFEAWSAWQSRLVCAGHSHENCPLADASQHRLLFAGSFTTSINRSFYIPRSIR
jgi:hypothetical protein